MNKKNIFFLIFFLSLVSISLVSAVWWNPFTWGEGDPISIQSSGQSWQVQKATDTEANFTLWTANKDDKKTGFGFILKPNTIGDLSDKSLYDEVGQILDDKNKPIILKYETAKCGGLDCYHISLTEAQAVNIDDFIQLGENSIAVVYQDQNLINYDLGFANLNISLSCEGINQNDIFIYENQDNYKFGANGTFEGIKRCNYLVQSTSEIHNNLNKPYITDQEWVSDGFQQTRQGHIIDFNDVANRFFNCHNETLENETYGVCDQSAQLRLRYFSEVQGNETIYYLNASFYSDNLIDPVITIDNLITDAVFDNVICEAGGDFCHLNITDQNLLAYYSFDDIRAEKYYYRVYDSHNATGVFFNGTWSTDVEWGPIDLKRHYISEIAGASSNISLTYNFTVPSTGEFSIYATWETMPGSVLTVPHNVSHDGGNTIVNYDQKNLSNNNRWNKIGSFSFTLGNTYTLRVQDLDGNDPVGYRVNADAMMVSNDSTLEKKIIYDYSNNDFDGYLQNSWFSDSPTQSSFTGSGGYGMNLSGKGLMTKMQEAQEFSISFWFYKNQTSYLRDNTVVFSVGQDTTHRQPWIYAISGYFRAYVDRATADCDPYSIGYYIPAFEWSHWVFYYNSTGCGWYSNATYLPSGDDVTSSGARVNATVDEVYISGDPTYYGLNSSFIDEIMIFNKSLSKTEIQQIYASTYPRFASKGNHTLETINFASGLEKINTTINETNQGTSQLSIRFIYPNDTYTELRNVSEGSVQTTTINNSTTSLVPVFNYYTEPISDFYTPILFKSVLFEPFTSIVPVDDPPFSIVSYPANNSNNYTSTIKFTINATDDNNLSSINLTIWNKATGLVIASNNTNVKGLTNQSNVTITFVADAVYLWNAKVNDSNSAIDWATNRTINISANPFPQPFIQNYTIGNISNINYFWIMDNMSVDLNMTSCSRGINFNWTNETGDLLATNTNFSFDASKYEIGSHNISLNCYDIINNKTTQDFRIRVFNNTDWVLMVLPDTQYYGNNDSIIDAFKNQTQFIRHMDRYMNILFTIHEGDFVQTGSNIARWNLANESMSLLNLTENPHFAVPGNHDNTLGTHDERNLTNYAKYFNLSTRYSLQDWWGGNKTTENDGNTYQLFNDTQGRGYLVLNYEFCPRNATLNWAQNVVGNHSDRIVITNTHAYLQGDATRTTVGDTYDCDTYFTGGDYNDGDEIWDYFIKLNPNIRFTFSGHFLNNVTAYNDSLNDAGLEVHQSFLNFQTVNGYVGDGWMGILTMAQSENKVYHETFSPWLNQLNTTGANNVSHDFDYELYSAPESVPPVFTSIPANETLEYKVDSLGVDFNATDETAFDTYEVNDTTNFAINDSGWLSNLTVLDLKVYYVNITINDTTNNLNSTLWNVSVNDTTVPKVVINSPANTTYNTPINYTINATDLRWVDTCWFSINANVSNETLINSTYVDIFNFTAVAVYSDNTYLLQVWCNDTKNNINQTETIYFTQDTSAPVFPAVTGIPPNKSLSWGNKLVTDFNATDSGVGVDGTSWRVNDTTNFEINNTGGLTNKTTLTARVYILNISINDTLLNINSTLWNVTMNASADSISPIFVIKPDNITIDYRTNFTVRYNASDETKFDSYKVNDTRFTINESGSLFNNTGLSVRTYLLNITINDSSNNLNSTLYKLIVNQNTTLVLGLTATTPITYPTVTDFAGSGCPSQLSCSLNLSNAVYPVGTRSANYSTAGNANYTATSTTFSVTINRGTSQIDMKINGSDSAFQRVGNQSGVWINTTNITGAGTIEIYVNGVLNNSNASHTLKYQVTWTTGDYNVTAKFINTSNWTIAWDNIDVNISIGVDNPPVWTTIANYTHIANTSFSETVVATDDVGIDTYKFNETLFFNITRAGVIRNSTNLSTLFIRWINLSVNDTSNNINSTIIFINITLDSGLPVITIVSPENKTYFTYYRMDMPLQVSASKVISVWNYNLNGTNVTFTPNSTIAELGIGNYSLIVYGEDATGNVGNESVIFRVAYENEGNDMFLLYLGIFGVAVVLLIVGFKLEDAYITIFAGTLFIVMGIIFWTIGYPNLSNSLLKQSISYVLWAVGAYILFRSMEEILGGGLG